MRRRGEKKDCHEGDLVCSGGDSSRRRAEQSDGGESLHVKGRGRV